MFVSTHCRVLPEVILVSSIATLLSGDVRGADVFLRGSDPLSTTSFNSPGVAPNGWDNNEAPSSGNNYFTGPYQLRTPTGTTGATFAGSSLTIGPGGSLSLKGSGEYRINNLILNGGSIDQSDVGVPSPNNIGRVTGSILVTAQSTFYTSTAPDRIIDVNAAIHGTGGMTIAGFAGTYGAVNFNLTSDFTGPLTLGGTTPLVIYSLDNAGIPSAIGASNASAANLIFDGGPLRIRGNFSSSTDRLFTITPRGGGIESAHATAAVSFTNPGLVALSGTGARTFTLSGVSTGTNLFAPTIGDNGGPTSVTKAGAGFWEMTATNTYTGATTINGGTLAFSSIINFGLGSALNMGGATLVWKPGNTTDITSVRNVILTGGNAVMATSGQTLTFSGTIAGPGSLVRQGGGMLTLSGANTFAGDFAVGNGGGAVRITNSQSFGIGTKLVTVPDSRFDSSDSGLLIAGGSGAILLPGSIELSTLSPGTGPAIVNESGHNAINGRLRPRGDTRIVVDGGSLALNGPIVPATNSALLYLGGAGNGVVNGSIIDDSDASKGAIYKEGPGTWVLNGKNGYTGLTVVDDATLITTTNSTGGGAFNVYLGATLGVKRASPSVSFPASSLNYYNGGANNLLIDFGGFELPTNPAITVGASFQTGR